MEEQHKWRSPERKEAQPELFGVFQSNADILCPDGKDTVACWKAGAAIVGHKDIISPPKYSYFMADNLVNVKVVIIPGGTHMVLTT